MPALIEYYKCFLFGLVAMTISLATYPGEGLGQASGDNGIWERGKKGVKQGDYDRALKIWESARMDTFKGKSSSDPRIGFDYIALVTEQKLVNYYQTASDMYFWALKGCRDTKEVRNALKKEMARLEPIASEKTFQRWERLLIKEAPMACRAIRNFWKSKDPTLASDYNERLLEHWRRIAYAREHFTRNRTTVYDADDRALIYVRHGKPDYKRDGIIHFRNSSVRGWVHDIMELHMDERRYYNRRDTSGSGRVSRTLEYLIKREEIENYVKEARILHNYPTFEIWVYHSYVGRGEKENLIYIFGTDGASGSFGLRRSMEDLLSGRAFQQEGRILSPGLLLQMMAYEQLLSVDNYFGEVLNELESQVYSSNGLHHLTSFAVRSSYRHELRRRQYQAPTERWRIENELPSVELNIYQYRHLNDMNEPYLASYIKAMPRNVFFLSPGLSDNLAPENYSLRYYAAVFDQRDNMRGFRSYQAPAYTKGMGNVNPMRESVAYVKMPHFLYKTDQVFTLELRHKSENIHTIHSGVIDETLKAIGKAKLPQPDPLVTSEQQLEMSDLILGVADSTLTNYTGPAHFKVKHEGKIDKNENLMVHFEVYHLQVPENSQSSFKVEYQVTPRKRNLFERIFGGGEEVGLTLHYESEKSYYKTDLEIVTSSFDPGKYKLILKAIEPSTNREVNREVSFEIRDEN